MRDLPAIRSPLNYLAVLLFALTAAMPAYSAVQPDPQASEYDEAIKAVQATIRPGPVTITLINQATLKIPQGYGYIPDKVAGRLLRAIGNVVHTDPVGMVLPMESNAGFVVIRWQDAGYIKDDDAKDWKADELLNTIRTSTEQDNETRRSRHVPEVEIVGWVEPPKYDAGPHQLVWSVASKHKQDPNDAPHGINYNTYALGREGFFSMNLVTSMNDLETQKPMAHTLLAGLGFNDGKRYTDFNSSTDKVAEYGLAALVAGVAAKKLGLLALIGAFIAKFAKIILISVAAFGAGIARWWKQRGAPKT